MIEGGWACLLTIAGLYRETRPLAFLLALKWVCNYTAVKAGLWTGPAYIDIVAGTVGILMALNLPCRRCGDVLIACFVVTPLFHALHWMLWGAGTYVGVQYFVVMLGLYTAQVSALAWPGVKDQCLRFSRLWPAPVGWSGFSAWPGAGRRKSRITKPRVMR